VKQYKINCKENHKQYMNMKRKTDLKYNLNCKISRGIYKALRGNKAGRHWETIVGYTINNLIKYLRKTMPKGYCWQDYLKGKLHIDHIIPIRAFVFNKPEDEEFKQCWSLCNIRLLSIKENLIKHDSINNPILLGLLLKELV